MTLRPSTRRPKTSQEEFDREMAILRARPVPKSIPLSKARFHRWTDDRRGGPEYRTRDGRRVSGPFVYFVSSGDFLKIGFSGSGIRSRLSILQGASPTELIIEAVVPGDRESEAGWHAAFEPFRVHREWFALNDGSRHLLNPVRHFSIIL